AGPTLPGQVRHPLPSAPGWHQRRGGREGDAASAPRIYVVPDDGFPGERRQGPTSTRRVLPPRPGAPAPATDQRVRTGVGEVAEGTRAKPLHFFLTPPDCASGSTRRPMYSPAMA